MLSCVDDTGAPVAWWLALKYPESSSPEDDDSLSIHPRGSEYSLITSDAPEALHKSGSSVTRFDSALARTLAPIYDGTAKHLLYNDQPPNTTFSSSSHGHSKGVVAIRGGGGGFFVQHSIPRFPQYPSSGYGYGESQLRNGQHAFCMSLDANGLDAVAFALAYARPYIYHLSEGDDTWPTANLTALASGSYIHASDGLNGLELSASLPTTSGDEPSDRTPLRLYAKTHWLSSDMVSNIIAPSLGTSMWSQSWLNTGGVLGAACPVSDVFGGSNVDGVSVVDATLLEAGPESSITPWHTHDDHSKWAVAMDDDKPWSCFSDNNRVHSQLTRSGLSVCIHHEGLHTAMHGVVREHNECPTHDPSPPPLPPASPPPPMPPPVPPASPLACCYYSDGACNMGDACCTSSCTDPTACSYTRTGCLGQYGRRHGCEWMQEEGQCRVGGVPPPLPPPTSPPVPSLPPLSPPPPQYASSPFPRRPPADAADDEEDEFITLLGLSPGGLIGCMLLALVGLGLVVLAACRSFVAWRRSKEIRLLGAAGASEDAKEKEAEANATEMIGAAI